MPDRDEDTILVVGESWDGEERRDRPALHNLEVIRVKTPFDILRLPEVRLDSSTKFR